MRVRKKKKGEIESRRSNESNKNISARQVYIELFYKS